MFFFYFSYSCGSTPLLRTVKLFDFDISITLQCPCHNFFPKLIADVLSLAVHTSCVSGTRSTLVKPTYIIPCLLDVHVCYSSVFVGFFFL